MNLETSTGSLLYSSPMVFITKGDFIWVEAAANSVTASGAPPLPIGARVLNAATSANERIVVIDDDGNERRLSAEQKIRVMHPTSIQGVEDLVRLEDLHEAAVVRNLFIRYREKLIYTYVGSVLVSVNPHRALPLYGQEYMSLYQRHRAEALPPHIYGVASKAYRQATAPAARFRAQCIVMDGLAGAGKSEAVKHILKYFAHQNTEAMQRLNAQQQQRALCRAQQVVDANLILEAFGNAQTATNPNSSRVSKFIDLQFDVASGVLESAHIEHYMLDKSRVVLQAGAGERNYHIFYSLLRDLSAADKFELELGTAGEYHILSQGDFIWVEAAANSVTASGAPPLPIGARVLNAATSANERIVVIDDDGNERRLSAEQKIRVMHPTSIQGVEDLVRLEDLHEAAVVRNLFIRYREKLIYTYVGSVLVSVNPHRALPLYGQEYMSLYQRHRAEALPPHIYGVASKAYRQATAPAARFRAQCIVMDGLAGAGKSEAVKHILKYFAHQNTEAMQRLNAQQQQRALCRAQQVVDANLILEAFGNAQTATNPNSSRVSKFIDLQFDVASGVLESAHIEHYMLDKSRVVLQAGAGERNYHIFYSLLRDLSAADKFELELGTAGEYHILSQTPYGESSQPTERQPRASSLAQIRCAMKSLMFKDAEVTSIFKVLAALLHLGNLKYQVNASEEPDESVTIADPSNLRKISKLLQLNQENLANALCQRTVVSHGECIITTVDALRALDTRDALIKGVYARLFSYVMRRCNEALQAPHLGLGPASKSAGSTDQELLIDENQRKRRCAIGILDLFGFGSGSAGAGVNTFEQFCANFAAEQLHQFYVRLAFKVEQTDYEAQHIDWHYVDCGAIDNAGIVELLAHQPMSLISVLNDESIRPEATCDSFLDKLHSQHELNPLYVRPKSELCREFTINHYAGPITYQAPDFLTRNRDSFTADLLALVESSRLKFLHRLFEDQRTGGTLSAGWTDENLPLAGNGVPIRQTRILQFRRAIDALLQRLEQRQTQFVRCIKPNTAGAEMQFDRELVAEQLRQWGVIETTLMQRNGYAVRYDYASFVRKYRMFLPNGGAPRDINCAYAARHICSVLLGDNADFRFGQTMLFLKAEHELFLDEELHKVLTHYATVAQKIVRGWIQRRRFMLLQRAAVVLQKNWRARVQKAKYEMMLRGIGRLQAVFRSQQLIQHYNRLKSIVTQFQAHYRGAIVRKMLRAANSTSACRAEIFARYEELMQDNNCGENARAEEGRLDNDLSFNDEARFQSTTNGPDLKVDYEKIKPYTFEKFAAIYFQGQASGTYTKKALRHPLLRADTTTERMAALTSWVCVQRLMGTLPQSPLVPDGKINDKANGKVPSTSLMRRIHVSFGKSYGKKEYQRFLRAYYSIYELEAEKHGSTVTHSDKTEFFTSFVQKCRQASQTQLIQFIVGCGILNPGLRDEILCQICKQLTMPAQNDYRQRSHGSNTCATLRRERGWVLLAMCVSCFVPSPKFLKYFMCFLRIGENDIRLYGYPRFVAQKLRRTLDNGRRCQPPSRIEIEACKSKRNLHLSVALMDGSVVQLSADSATTSAEICADVARRAGLRGSSGDDDPTKNDIDDDGAFGFSLYVALADKVSSLGDGADHVLDAVSQSEQMWMDAAENGSTQSSDSSATAPACRLFYRKEVFTPWHNLNKNSAATNLIYHQVIRGIKFGEYKCHKEEELALLCAQQYFIDYGNHIQLNVLEAELSNYLPEATWNNGDCDVEKWAQIVLNILRKKFSKDARETVESVKASVVAFAMHKWPLLFSRFCEAIKFAGPPLRTNEVVIAVNATGVSILDHLDQPLLDFTYTQLTRVNYNRSKRVGADTVTLHTLADDTYTFQSPNARDIGALVEHFISGLRRHSKYMIYVRQSPNECGGLECQKGDLLILNSQQDEVDVQTDGYVVVENARTGLHGSVPTSCVYVLPTLTKPSVDLMEQFSRQFLSKMNFVDGFPHANSGRADNDALAIYQQQQQQHLMTAGAFKPRPHTLEQFAAANFNPPPRDSAARHSPGSGASHSSDTNSVANGGASSDEAASDAGGKPSSSVPSTLRAQELWKWSPFPLRRALLKRVGSELEPAGAECLLGYEFIMKYMGDLPSPRPSYFLEFTDIIFRGAVKYQILRDEVYCQLMKQLTDNPRPFSEQRGWELMWLCVGLFPPSVRLAKELTQFLRSRYLPLAADSLLRLQRTIKLNAVRKFPPHQVEVEAIQHGTTQIFHKVFLPDASEIVVEVDSLTTSRDIGARILAKLHVRSTSGFSVFVKIGEKVISMPENEFLFDFIHQLADWMLQNRAQLKQNNNKSNGVASNNNAASHPPFSYQLFFMRKLWIDVVPGEDPNADLCFHFHQELPKYLRGYYGVNKALAAQIGAIILRAKTRDGHRPPFQQFAHIIADIVPRHLIKSHNTSEWKKIISSEFEKLDVENSSDAKILFLKRMATMPTYGSAFFEVKQSSDPTLAQRLIVAINRAGVNLFNQDNHEHIISYPFTAINNWTFGNTYLHLTIGSTVKGSRLLLETTLGYKMDDLLTSYIQTLLSSIDRNRRGNGAAQVREMEVA